MAPYIESTGNYMDPIHVGLLPGERDCDLPREIRENIEQANTAISTNRDSLVNERFNMLIIGLLRAKIGLPEKYSELLKNAVTKGDILKIAFDANIVHPQRVDHDYETKNHRVMKMEIGHK